MVSKTRGCGEMISMWRKRYVLIAVVLVSVVLLNQLSRGTITDLIPLQQRPLTDAPASPPAPAPYTSPFRPPKPIEPPQLATSLEVAPSRSPALLNTHDYEFSGAYVGWPLQRVCNETTFIPGLVYVCDNNSGGIGNIRNFILTCIRYGIEAGASGIILPRIQQRSEENLANIYTTGFKDFDYFFDEEHFRSAFTTFCPQVTIFDEEEEIPHVASKKALREFYPKDLNADTDGCDGRGINRHLDHFRPRHDKWILKLAGHMPSVDQPVTVRFKWATFFEWPIYRDGPEFAATFGDLLRIRQDIQQLAAITLAEMSRFVGVEPDPKRQVFNAPFLGAHLRTESDALGFWPDYKQQSEGYLKQASLRNLKHAYLACGNLTEAHRFADDAFRAIQLNVTSKLDLLKGEDLKRLTDLSWDQQALVDFLVLQKSTHFTGCSFSSFTMNIAFKRHLMTDGIMTRQWRSPGDSFSTMVGRWDYWYGDWVFMYECMWP